MRISLTMTIALMAALTSPMLADTVVPQRVLEFSPAPDTAGQWHYNGAGILSFDQDDRRSTAPWAATTTP